MNEAYLTHLYTSRKLGRWFQTTEEKELTIVDFGQPNANAGPDFLQACIRYDQKLWFGAIEFHLRSSDWFRHGHHKDAAYGNVIAHFVYEHDRAVTVCSVALPTVVLKPFVDTSAFPHYWRSQSRRPWIPCAQQLGTVDRKVVQRQLKGVLSERFARKSNEVVAQIDAHKGDQRKVLLLLLAKAMGGTVNQVPFVQLVEKISFEMLRQLNFDEFRVQALLHGISGLLPEGNHQEHYVADLTAEFRYLKRLFRLLPMQPTAWKFSTLRPASAPPVRIAQLAQLLSRPHFVQQLNAGLNYRSLDVHLHEFWETHYHFNKKTAPKKTAISVALQRSIQINAIIPFGMAVRQLRGEVADEDQLREDLSALEAEQNSTVRQWKKLGVDVRSACDTQALIEQKKKYCDLKKCLSCTIGQVLLHP